MAPEIFIIDADVVLLKAYKQFFKSRDLEVITFTSPQKAIKALNGAMPKIIVLELALPGHNGFEFLYELRSYNDTRSISVIIYSQLIESSVDFSYVSKADLGISRYLSKADTTLDKLLQCIREEIS
jgi:DNA-binding response OmpR family regulator